MSQVMNFCTIAVETAAKLKKFRMQKIVKNSALILKIDPASKEVIIEDSFEDGSIEDLVELLPSQQPRYIAFTMKQERDNGRIAYPLVLFFFSPIGAKIEHQMMYVSTLNQVMDIGGFTKQFEIRDVEDLTEEWLEEQLKFFT